MTLNYSPLATVRNDSKLPIPHPHSPDVLHDFKLCPRSVRNDSKLPIPHPHPPDVLHDVKLCPRSVRNDIKYLFLTRTPQKSGMMPNHAPDPSATTVNYPSMPPARPRQV